MPKNRLSQWIDYALIIGLFTVIAVFAILFFRGRSGSENPNRVMPEKGAPLIEIARYCGGEEGNGQYIVCMDNFGYTVTEQRE